MNAQNRRAPPSRGIGIVQTLGRALLILREGEISTPFKRRLKNRASSGKKGLRKAKIKTRPAGAKEVGSQLDRGGREDLELACASSQKLNLFKKLRR